MRLSAYLFNTGDGNVQELNCAGVLRRLLEKKININQESN
jgi:hypothetical protein